MLVSYHGCLRAPRLESHPQDQLKKAVPLGADNAKNLTRVGILGGSQGEEKGGFPVSHVSHIYLWADISQDRKSTFCQLFHFSTLGWFCLPLVIPWCPASQCRHPPARDWTLTPQAFSMCLVAWDTSCVPSLPFCAFHLPPLWAWLLPPNLMGSPAFPLSSHIC